MGRRAIYFTYAEKQAAARSRRRKNAELPSNKHLRSQQNRRAYINRLASEPVTGTTTVSYPPPPTIPQVLQALADIQLPTTRAFSYAHRGDFGDFSVEDLDRCRGPPPYALPSIWDDPAYLDEEHFLTSYMAHIAMSNVHSKRPGYETITQVAHEVFVNEVLSMLTRSISEWETAERIIGKRNGDTIEDRLGNQYLQWRARWVIDLAADYNALLLGNDKFLCTFVERWRHLE
ncbi:hypothetical protein BD779DRAFT_1681331 [Infundibulicybe gibba]|nr:hypothetical protein BD779DRAFT_1681331 [Infundibulicybe gibba]